MAWDDFLGGDFLNQFSGPTFQDVPAPSDFWTSANAAPAPDFGSVPSPSDFWGPGGAADFFGGPTGTAGASAPSMDISSFMPQGFQGPVGPTAAQSAPPALTAPPAPQGPQVMPQVGAPAAGGPAALPGGPTGGTQSGMPTGTDVSGAPAQAAPGGGKESPGMLEKLGIWGPQGLGKNALPALAMLAPLVKQAMTPNVYSKMGGTGATALQQLGKAPLDVSNQLLQQYMSGKVMPAQAYDIQQWALQAKARLQDQFARMGLGSSSQLQLALNDIDAKAAAMMDQARQNVLQSGLSAAGVGQGPTKDAIIAQMQMDQQGAQAQQAFLAALAKMGTQANPAPGQ